MLRELQNSAEPEVRGRERGKDLRGNGVEVLEQEGMAHGEPPEHRERMEGGAEARGGAEEAGGTPQADPRGERTR